MSSLSIYLLCAVAGSFGGLLMGTVGGGIGPIVVPTMLFLLPLTGIPKAEVAHFAIAISLTLILITTSFSIRFHHRHHSIDWPLVIKLLPGSLLGAGIGTYLAFLLSTNMLKIIFGFFLLLLSIQIVRPNFSNILLPKPPNFILFGLSTMIASISNMLGIGDGVLLVPYLKKYIPVFRAVATATVIILPVSFIGSMWFLIMGLQSNQHALSIGYIYLPFLFVLGIPCIIFCRLGVYLTRNLPENILKYILAFIVLLVGLQLVI